MNEEYPSEAALEDLRDAADWIADAWRQPGEPVQPCCNRMLARRGGAGTGIHARHVTDTRVMAVSMGMSRIFRLKRLVMITEVAKIDQVGRPQEKDQ